MRTKEFWIAAGERAIRTFAQALAAVLTAGATGLLGVDWVGALSTAGMAALLSLLMSIGASGVGNDGPSFGPERLEP